MKSTYQHIFSPLTVKNMTIKNRVVMMPMGTNYGEQNGEMSFLHINYYKERAKGGTGLIIVENASVDSPQGSNGTTQLRIDHDNYLPRLYKFCEEIHKYGTCIAIQINHAGASAVSARTNMQPVSASDVPSKEGGEIPRPLTVEEIHHIVKKYGEAAIIEMIMQALPEIAKNVAEPLSKVDKITMYGEGNSAKMLQDIINSTTQVTEGLAQGMGIDVKALLSSIVGAKIASNTPEDTQKSDSDEYEQ